MLMQSHRQRRETTRAEQERKRLANEAFARKARQRAFERSLGQQYADSRERATAGDW